MVDFVRFRILVLFAFCFFAFSWIMPNHNPPWTSAYQEFSSFFACLILLALTAFLFRQVSVTPAICFFFLLSVVPILQFWTGKMFFASDALMASLFISGFSVMLLVGLNFSLWEGSRRFFVVMLASVMVAAAVLSVCIAMRQWLLFPSGSFWVIDVPWGARPFANLAQPNNLATLLCMGLSGVFYLYEARYINRFSSSLLAIFLILGVALTQSRTPWVSVVAVLLYWTWRSSSIAMRLPFFALCGWVVFYVFFVFALPYVAEVLYLSGEYVVGGVERASVAARLTMWGQLWQAVLAGGWLGYGWGQVSVAQVAVSAMHPAPGLMTLYAHNILLDLLLWNGPVLGFVVILLISVWLFRMGWRVTSVEGFFALLVAGFILVHAMLEYPHAYAFFLLPLGLVLGVALADVKRSSYFQMSRAIIAFLAGSGFFVFFWLFGEYRVIDEYYRVSRLEEAKIVGAEAGKVPDVILLSEPREYIRFVRTPVGGRMTDAQLEWMRKVVLRRPGAFGLFRYALALGVNGKSTEALAQLVVLRAQYGESVYLQALDELQRLESDHPQLSALRDPSGDCSRKKCRSE